MYRIFAKLQKIKCICFEKYENQQNVNLFNLKRKLYENIAQKNI